MWSTQTRLPWVVALKNFRPLKNKCTAEASAFRTLSLGLLNSLRSQKPRKRGASQSRHFVTLSSCQSDLQSVTTLRRHKNRANPTSMEARFKKPLCDGAYRPIQRAHLFGWGSKSTEQKLDYLYTTEERPEGRWPVKRVLVETNKDLYEDDPYPVRLDVTYVDTVPEDCDGCQTVLIIHGAPGSHHDFFPIIDILAKERVRVIAVNMPGYGLTKGVTELDDRAFIHSTAECADFLLDFLVQIKAPKIDMLVAHGTGSSAALQIIARTSKAMALTAICPLPNHLNNIEQSFFVLSMVKNQENTLWRGIIDRYIKNKVTQFGFSAEDSRHMMHALLALSQTQSNELADYAMSIGLRQRPVLAFYSDDDQVVSPSKAAEFLDLIGITEERTAACDANGELSSIGERFSAGYPKGVRLTSGGHYPHLKYPQVFAEEILKFLHHLSQQDSTS